jgi:hypothetical protein
MGGLVQQAPPVRAIGNIPPGEAETNFYSAMETEPIAE